MNVSMYLNVCMFWCKQNKIAFNVWSLDHNGRNNEYIKYIYIFMYFMVYLLIIIKIILCVFCVYLPIKLFPIRAPRICRCKFLHWQKMWRISRFRKTNYYMENDFKWFTIRFLHIYLLYIYYVSNRNKITIIIIIWPN